MTESVAHTLAVQRCRELLKLAGDELSLRIPIHYAEPVREKMLAEAALVLSLERLMQAAGATDYALPSVAKLVVTLGRMEGMAPSDIFETMMACMEDALLKRMQSEERQAAKQ